MVNGNGDDGESSLESGERGARAEERSKQEAEEEEEGLNEETSKYIVEVV